MATPDSWRPTRLSVVSWAVYDLANTIFALGVGGLYFPKWLTENDATDLSLALAINAAMAAVIVLAPWIGARSDHRGRRVGYLVPATLLAVGPTFFLATVGVLPSLALFSVALVGFHLGSVVYDALLPDVSTAENRGRISGFGVGVGYLGSFIAVLVGVVLLGPDGHPAVFRTIALLFLLFALPSFLFVKERPRGRQPGPPPAIGASLRRLADAWRRARTYRGVARFLIGRFFYTDAINTLIGGFLTIFVIEELGFSDGEVQGLLAVGIVGAMLGGLVGGRIVDAVGPRRLLNATITTWAGAVMLGVIAALADVRLLAWALGVIGGFALGATWSADRVYMARISPPRYLGEFYGLYATVGRFATFLGPLMWGLLVTVAGFPRTVAMGALVVFLVVSRLILGGVDDRPRVWATNDLEGLGVIDDRTA
ncbi:MAG: MFS transporter [Acidimicrobiia bacterium]